jgi:hypothetical protein
VSNLSNYIGSRLHSINAARHGRRLGALLIASIIGAFLGKTGFGAYYLGLHNPKIVTFFHGPLILIGAWLLATIVYANSVTNRLLSRSNLTPGAVALLQPQTYSTLFGTVYVLWALWTLPLWVAWQLLALLLASVTALRDRLSSQHSDTGQYANEA